MDCELPLIITNNEIKSMLGINSDGSWNRFLNKADGFPETIMRGKRVRREVVMWLKDKGYM
ncbi:hypothetical protein WAX88_16195 [Photobacterium damselae subsp. damselae]|uniref:hypothetical protein n=1 Tax=Photobacterium damselae TaxID=38293 RepID=UPI00311B1F66